MCLCVLVRDHLYIEIHRRANVDFILMTFVLINNCHLLYTRRLTSLNLKIDHSGIGSLSGLSLRLDGANTRGVEVVSGVMAARSRQCRISANRGPWQLFTRGPLLTRDKHTHPFNGPFSGTTRVSRYQKGRTSLDFTEARDSEWQWHELGHMQVCT